MGTISRSYTFAAGAKPTAAQWNVDIDAIISTINGGIDENNIDQSANYAWTGTNSFAGSVSLTATLTVGVDDTGHDVKFFGATSGKSWLWDESADTMIVTGAATISETLLVTGVTTHGGNVVSDTDSTDDLGTSSVRWANLFVDSIGDTGQDLTVAATTVNLPSGHIFDYNGADVTITHAANVLAIEGGLVGIGETDNTGMTIGLTINQGANDDQIFACKSSDIATGLTSATSAAVETDDFFVIEKQSATIGGAKLQAMAEDAATANVMTFKAYGGTANTAKTTGATALFEFAAYEHDGANGLANITADGNVFSVAARVGGSTLARFLVDEDGDLYSVTAAQTFDGYDDVALLSAYDHAVAPDQVIRSDYEDFAKYNEDTLVRAGVLGAPVAEGGMTNVTQLQRLHNGALRQLARENKQMAAELIELREKMLRLEERTN